MEVLVNYKVANTKTKKTTTLAKTMKLDNKKEANKAIMSKQCEYSTSFKNMKEEMKNLNTQIKKDLKNNPVKTGAVVFGIGLAVGAGLTTIYNNRTKQKNKKVKYWFNKAIKSIGGKRR